MGTVLDRLLGGLWHTTRPELFRAIMSSGGLLPEPDIDDAIRWNTKRGLDYYPFVRKLGSVSLFDFRNFDPVQYEKDCRSSNWRSFVPHLERWRGAVWIEINQTPIADHFKPANQLARELKEGGHYHHTLMPRIEAAHIGPLPREAFSSAFLTWSFGQYVREINLFPFDEADFNAHLNEWQRSTTDQSLPGSR